MQGGVRVWDPAIRIGHWLLVTSVAAAWLTKTGWESWHERLGYVALAVMAGRVVWGFVGPVHARFSDFIVAPPAGLDYAREMLARREPRYLGHNPLGGWTIVALLLMVGLVGASGWLYTTDRFWGVAWVEELHEQLSNLLLILVALHVAGVLYASYRHRENLIAAMIHGRKREHD